MLMPTLSRCSNERVTHLIVQVDDKNRTQRTLKFLNALACGKWIVSVGWVQQCAEENRFVDEEPFEVLDVDGDDGPNRARICSPEMKLFKELEFSCVEPFTQVTVGQLWDLLERCGAIMVHDPSEMPRGNSIAIFELHDGERTADQMRQARLLHNEHGVQSVSNEWIFDCIATHRILPIHDYLIVNNTSTANIFGVSDMLP